MLLAGLPSLNNSVSLDKLFIQRRQIELIHKKVVDYKVPTCMHDTQRKCGCYLV